jgi:hypothetical protein
VDPTGNVWVAWLDQRTVPYQLWCRKYDADSSAWLPEQRLTARAVNCFPAAVATDGEGNIHVAWHEESWPERGIWYKRYDAAQSAWQAETLLHPLPSHRNGSYPVLSTAPNSDRVQLVWAGHTDTSTVQHILHREYRPDSGWSGVTQVTTAWCNHDQAAVAADSAGNVCAVWSGMDLGSLYNHVHCRRRVAGRWQDVEHVSDMPGAPTQYAPAVAVSPDGRRTGVIWHGRASGDIYQRIIYRQRTPAGWLDVEDASPRIDFQQEYPDVAFAAGSTAAVWRGPTGSSPSVCQLSYAERDSTGYWSSPQQLTSNASGNVCEPAIATAGRDLHVVWYDNSSGNQDAYYLHGTRPSAVFEPKPREPPRQLGALRLLDACGRVVTVPRDPGVYFIMAAPGGPALRKLVVCR